MGTAQLMVENIYCLQRHLSLKAHDANLLGGR